MLNRQIALLVDNLNNNEQTQQILTEVLSKNTYNVTIFTLSKENIVSCPLPIFNIADFFNWKDISIITSQKTLEKTIHYPVKGPHIIVGKIKYPGYLNIDNFNLDLIEKAINDSGHQENNG